MRTIFTGLAPNTEGDDATLALRLLFQPWRWRRGPATAQLEGEFRQFLKVPHVISTTSGRTSLALILRALHFEKGSEILIQAYTCVAVPDPILWEGLVPVYVDCDPDTLSMSIADLQKKLTKKTKAIVLQHTFGTPGSVKDVVSFAKRHNLVVIEDCAHALGAQLDGKFLGTFGDLSFFSFGRDKVISSVFGSVIATNRSDLAASIETLRNHLSQPSAGWVFQQLLHPIVMVAAKATYGIRLGKILLWISRKLKVLSLSVYPEERRGGKPKFIEKKMPNALALLALHQFKKLSRFNQHRRAIAGRYVKELAGAAVRYHAPYNSIFLRFTVFHKDAEAIRAFAHKRGVFLGDWYATPVAPTGVDYDAIKFNPLSCPVANDLARQTFNLPTAIHIKESDARRISEIVKEYLEKVNSK